MHLDAAWGDNGSVLWGCFHDESFVSNGASLYALAYILVRTGNDRNTRGLEVCIFNFKNYDFNF